jgi:hypothetical protein
MAGKLAVVDYRKCDPQKCGGGACAAVLACPRKLLRQEDANEPPYDRYVALPRVRRLCPGVSARRYPDGRGVVRPPLQPTGARGHRYLTSIG